MRKSLQLCLISDTHGLHRELDLPRADLLLHAGDIAMVGNLDHIRDFDGWLTDLGLPTILVPGNHDVPVAEDPGLIRNASVLLGRGARIRGLQIWGVPWSCHAAHVSPRIHVCGHVHAGRGMTEFGETTCINASMLGPDGDLCGNPYVLRISTD